MSFKAHNLRRLGNKLAIPIPMDKDGFVGRECPQENCEGYFKVKPGTGLTGNELPCHCPYCGHTGAQNSFWTKEQIKYAKSVALRRITDAVREDLKSLEFEVKPKGPFGIGMAMKLQPGAPVPIRYYREKALETHVMCTECSLEYAVFGVFAFCPDCRTHNSLQILQKNLDLVSKQLALAEKQSDVDLRRHLVEDGLENCVSAFDGFARECCRIRAGTSADPTKCENLSFQNLHRACMRLNDLFGIDLRGNIAAEDWNVLHIGFMRRHLLEHRAGVVDQQYIKETGEAASLLGRRVPVTPPAVEALVSAVEKLGRILITLLPRA